MLTRSSRTKEDKKRHGGLTYVFLRSVSRTYPGSRAWRQWLSVQGRLEILGLRSRMTEYMKKASKNLEVSQQLQKLWYDQKAAMVEFHPGQKLRVLEPVAPWALQERWSGPYPVLEKKSEVTNLVDLGTSRTPKRVIHVNLLKPFHDRADVNMIMVIDEDQEAESEHLPDRLSTDLVPKPHTKDGKKEMRFYVDYRGLNSVTKTDAHPIPRADELIDKLGAAKYLSTFDFTAGN
ncbi:hypothetical protein NDU88_004696 [Pleurodeles waltl]|uniref:Integrase p58-like C-terminal domain-containing protein n=1 Tax=Pleurodeles waltl TaxID=8319 RepID=A0AAV7PI99_PLEWA|nr:hypothetical protein NDU88_004696 [Pleurodeles waltl]